MNSPAEQPKPQALAKPRAQQVGTEFGFFYIVFVSVTHAPFNDNIL